MDRTGNRLLRQLVADIEGAPYPQTIGSELYTIWYEHVRRDTQAALEYLSEFEPHLVDDDADVP